MNNDQEIRDTTASLCALLLATSTVGSGLAVHAMTGNLKAAFTVAAVGLVTTLGAAFCGYRAGEAGQRIESQKDASKKPSATPQ